MGRGEEGTRQAGQGAGDREGSQQLLGVFRGRTRGAHSSLHPGAAPRGETAGSHELQVPAGASAPGS